MSENYGLKVSLEGYDVKTCTELQTAFTNNSNLLKVAFTGNGVIGVTNKVTITHNLGYVPQFLVFGYDASTKQSIATGDAFGQLIAGSSTTQLIIYGVNGRAYTYYIFYESIDGTSQSIDMSSVDYGIKITKDGYDITSTDIDHQSLNSEKNCLKISKTGTYTTTSIDSSPHDVSIAHGLPYTPGFMFWFQINNDGKYYFGTSSDKIYWNNVDDTNIYFTYDGISTGQSIKLYYILFVENA